MHFCIRVIGLIQSALIPETGKIFCDSLDDVATELDKGKVREISPMASAHQLKGCERFYREDRDSRCGHGFEFSCNNIAQTLRGGIPRLALSQAQV